MLPDHVAMCHGFCRAAHSDAARSVCANKLARVGIQHLPRKLQRSEKRRATPGRLRVQRETKRVYGMIWFALMVGT